MTATPMIRGYSLQQTSKYLQTALDADRGKRALETLPAEVRGQLDGFAPAEWYPRSYSAALFRAIAASQPADETAAYNGLVSCGQFIATEATNTFLKLVMRIMTPTLFAKKIPDLWKRDQRGGQFEADVSDAERGLIRMRLDDVAGYDHIGIVSIGWIKFGMAALGKKDVRINHSGWSLATPAPRTIEYQIAWS
jgi:hypothetical protein